MGLPSFFGLLFLGAGPIASVFVVYTARKSFLVLLALAGAFYWLITLFVISSLFRAWAPLKPELRPYMGLVLVGVAIQEVARLGVWRFHKLSVRVLDHIARQAGDSPLSLTDRFGLGLTHGLAHGATHSTFFFLSWIPLCLGDGTMYAQQCPAMSVFLVAALSTLGLAAVLAGGTVVALDGLERRALSPAAATAALHLGAALLTLLNFARNGCLVSVPLLLAAGGCVSAWAGRLWWRRTMRVPRLVTTGPDGATAVGTVVQLQQAQRLASAIAAQQLPHR